MALKVAVKVTHLSKMWVKTPCQSSEWQFVKEVCDDRAESDIANGRVVILEALNSAGNLPSFAYLYLIIVYSCIYLMYQEFVKNSSGGDAAGGT